MKQYRARPAQAHCERCKELFVYFRTTRPRRICDYCLPLEKQASNFFYNTWAKVRRLEARQIAREAHATA